MGPQRRYKLPQSSDKCIVGQDQGHKRVRSVRIMFRDQIFGFEHKTLMKIDELREQKSIESCENP